MKNNDHLFNCKVILLFLFIFYIYFIYKKQEEIDKIIKKNHINNNHVKSYSFNSQNIVDIVEPIAE